MKKTMILFIFSLIFFNTAFAANVIRFSTEATYPPFEYVDQSGQLTGFDIALAKALCQTMKAECIFNMQSFSSLIPSLKLEKCDALIAAIGVTPERKKEVSFTEPYYLPSAVFVGAKKNHYTLKSIPGRVVGVQAGTTFEQYLHEKYGHAIQIKTYLSVQDAFLDLDAERVDVVLSDTPIAAIWLKQDNNSKDYGYVDKPISNEAYFGSGYAIAVRPNDKELLKSLNEALNKIKANGVYDQIKKQYFPNA